MFLSVKYYEIISPSRAGFLNRFYLRYRSLIMALLVNICNMKKLAAPLELYRVPDNAVATRLRTAALKQRWPKRITSYLTFFDNLCLFRTTFIYEKS